MEVFKPNDPVSRSYLLTQVEEKEFEFPSPYATGYNDAMRISRMAIATADAMQVKPMLESRWVLTESPYAEYEESVDGESHLRYTCENCGFKAGYRCDPDGFAGDQVLAPFCGGCGAAMKWK